MIRGSNLGRDKRFISSAKRPDGLWGPRSQLPMCTGGLYARDVRQTILHLVPKLRINGFLLPLYLSHTD